MNQPKGAGLLFVSLLVSLGLHQCFSGSHVFVTPSDTLTFWIDPIGTTLPFAFWALISLAILFIPSSRTIHLQASLIGYAMGWSAMTSFVLWIISLPQGPNLSSTMGIAVFFTPILFAPLFPIFFVPGYLLSRYFLRSPTPIST